MVRLPDALSLSLCVCVCVCVCMCVCPEKYICYINVTILFCIILYTQRLLW